MSIFQFIAEDSWLLRLIANHIGYFSFAIPVLIILIISKTTAYKRWPQPIRGVISFLIRILISDPSHSTLPDGSNRGVSAALVKPIPTAPNFTRHRIFKFIFSFIGLQISYVLWGLLQERMMTRTYDDEKFTNSQFLVFANRLLAMMVAFISMKIFYPVEKSTATGPPLYQYGIVSYANCMSTWFQYESLLYISFPVQVIAKSVKTIPVMILGKFVSGKTYPLRQYSLMLLMAVGIALFLSGYSENHTGAISSKRAKQSITTFNGLILLIFYLIFDAFTSNYQKHLFDHYSISFLHMMFSVNIISTVLTLTSLALSGTLFECLSFLQRHHLFMIHVFATSVCSSIGQLFIFSTIQEFGPVMFTIIMTMRQALSILLSCLFYGHQLSWISVVGINVAFSAILTHAFIQFKRSKQLNSSIV
ncbi:unnamed protein product [Rotaria socialis]|uniref:Adenosine 3'-phospho 5'-phosphosulfate transporter 1 n=1 Tax=Rotaria socialis TaxID=392032 RepID=A0A817YGA5_9BILA|nr:unnamed protein product [Rotaria socialis]CAF3410811.1 unnamed protein product [Rotaria socialis]CAF4304685.1 unnamed protein product [Rotaria socialis]CAF4636316.1 unnamed protein product [Rotaria socialis]